MKTISLFLFYITISCNLLLAQPNYFSFEIKGKTSEAFEKSVIKVFDIENASGDSIAADTITNGTFNLKGSIAPTNQNHISALVYLQITSPDNSSFFHLAVVDTSSTKIDLISETKLVYSGNKRQDKFQETYQIVLEALDSTLYYDSLLSQNKGGKVVERKLERIEYSLYKRIKNRYQIQERSKFLLYLIYSQIPKIVDSKDTSFLKSLCIESKGILNDQYAQAFCIASSKLGKERVKAPSFELRNNENQMIDFSEFREGKFTLLDFWASWCVPCRKEIPNLVNLFQFADTSMFQIISISIDEDKERWKRAIEAEGLNQWLQLIDDKNETADEYGIFSIPKYVLIDPEGYIVKEAESTSEIENSVLNLKKK